MLSVNLVSNRSALTSSLNIITNQLQKDNKDFPSFCLTLEFGIFAHNALKLSGIRSETILKK